MLPAARPGVVGPGKRLLPGQLGCSELRGYSAGSSGKWVPGANAGPGLPAYARGMRAERVRRVFYVAGAAGWVISAAVTAVTLRIWQLHVREVEQRAEEAERTRDEAAQRRAMQERLRIARELHDSLTHSISVIRVQAGVAVHLARKRGAEVPPALLAIQEAGADAARELRTTLSVLRSDEDGDSSRLAHLESLVARARAAGLPVTVTVTGAERALPTDVDQAAYRIVQEALTNVSRHAGQASASVQLRYTVDALAVQVDDDGAGAGTGPRPTGHGLGLIGMRERVTALGGRLSAGPRDGGGFRVHAELPAQALS
jgi:signal transduction histidine kinase